MSNLQKHHVEALKDEEFVNYTFAELGEILGNDEYSIALRTRLLWYLRAQATQIYHDNDEQMHSIVNALAKGLASNSVLLQHEICYVLGQIGHDAALPTLYKTLENTSFDVMTRHEAGEAIGAIKNPLSLPILTQYLNDDEDVVRETCMLAIKNIENRHKENDDAISTVIDSVDPTPAFSKKRTTQELEAVFLDASEDLYKKYKAMFALRNRAFEDDMEALMALCKGFKKDEGALFKHEIAFVLGQLQRKETADTLEAVLRDDTEHPMVRHEAAEALGSICDTQSLQVLDQFQSDECLAVKHSCEVAIDMHKYWSQYSTEVSGEADDEAEE